MHLLVSVSFVTTSLQINLAASSQIAIMPFVDFIKDPGEKKYCFVLCPFQEAVCVSIGVAVLVTFWSGRLLPLSSLH